MGAVMLRSLSIHKIFEGWATDAASQESRQNLASILRIYRHGFKIPFPSEKEQNETKGEGCNLDNRPADSYSQSNFMQCAILLHAGPTRFCA